MPKKNIIFLVNPISGSSSKAGIPSLIEKNIDRNKYEHQVIFTDYAGQGTEIAALASANKVDVIVAVGGDGTVNEIGKVLLGSNVAMAIIPAGSGNGLARHLKIPMNPQKAMQVINTGSVIRIDAGKVNDKHFFCTAGVGFDAHIGELFSHKSHRGLTGYVQATIREFFAYQPETYLITANKKTIERNAFLITFANAAQYGNNAYIAPQASIQDQYLDVCIMRRFPMLAGPVVGLRLFAKNIDKSKYVEYIRANEVILERKQPGFMHIDGEPVSMEQKLTIKVIPSSLNVLAPASR